VEWRHETVCSSSVTTRRYLPSTSFRFWIDGARQQHTSWPLRGGSNVRLQASSHNPNNNKERERERACFHTTRYYKLCVCVFEVFWL
jgi:hypothetical protein